MVVEIPLKDGPLSHSIFFSETKTSQLWRYQTTELNSLRFFLDTHVAECQKMEEKIFYQLYLEVLSHSNVLRDLAKALARLDLLTAMARVASLRCFTRPKMVEGDSHTIRILGGRHPVIEHILSFSMVQFIKNDCVLEREKQFALITGPNMGGKSTFLRQNAIIVLMAHCGLFVPADDALIGITDAIFTRIGASDSLTTNESTFMMEMKEMAAILKSATPRSLVVVDEIGRGTSPLEGKHMAQAIGKYLLAVNKSKVLFATHFYSELTDFFSIQFAEMIVCWQTSAMLIPNIKEITFIYRLVPGIATTSNSIHVARLAGIPEPILDEVEAKLKDDCM